MKRIERTQDAKILLVDDESLMREITINALTAGGYREIRSVFRLEQLKSAMESINPDLVIINGEMSDGDPVELVRQIRLFRIGRNPFVSVIMTSWNAEGAFVQRVVDGGIDVLMMKPFAAGQLLARIDFLVNQRPQFVATATYVGPDRRKARRDGAGHRFDAPNTLRDRIQGKATNPAEMDARISGVFSKIKRHRNQMQEGDIRRLFAALSQATREEGTTEDCEDIVDALIETVQRYLADMPMSAKARKRAKALAALLRQAASTTGGCALADCGRMADLIVGMGVPLPSEDGTDSPNNIKGIPIQSASAV